MKINKNELLISVIMVIILLGVLIGGSVLATSDNSDRTNLILTNSNIDNNSSLITIVGSNSLNNQANNIANNVANNNTPEQLADTGLESLPVVIICICITSAVFAYKKIKEYKID